MIPLQEKVSRTNDRNEREELRKPDGKNFERFIASQKFLEKFQDAEAKNAEFRDETGQSAAEFLQKREESASEEYHVDGAVKLRRVNRRNIFYIGISKSHSPREICRRAVIKAIEERSDISKKHADEKRRERDIP